VCFDVVARRDEDGYYIATVPELLGCHTQAKSLDGLMSRIGDAICIIWKHKLAAQQAASWECGSLKLRPVEAEIVIKSSFQDRHSAR